jgi:EAL domain-containing protein (putative c-di-GMP-specific phosphodiesterase class I)
MDKTSLRAHTLLYHTTHDEQEAMLEMAEERKKLMVVMEVEENEEQAEQSMEANVEVAQGHAMDGDVVVDQVAAQ